MLLAVLCPHLQGNKPRNLLCKVMFAISTKLVAPEQHLLLNNFLFNNLDGNCKVEILNTFRAMVILMMVLICMSVLSSTF